MNWVDLLKPQRIATSGESESSIRTSFEQDFDRIIFSSAFRKLQDKTQVFPLPEDDFVHTRLTHSLEVSSVGRSLGKKVGDALTSKYPVLVNEGITSHDVGTIVASASLAHDVGNPPFGHSGEQAISDFFRLGAGTTYKNEVSEAQWQDLANFEGNAQGFRILNAPYMKLTLPVLGAFTKYPLSSNAQKDPVRKSQRKYGYFQSERVVFDEMATNLGLGPYSNEAQPVYRHPLAFLVEAADDICYHIIDLEDGCTLGLVSETEYQELLAKILQNDFDRKKYNQISSRQQRIGTLRALAINNLVKEVVAEFLRFDEQILDGTYDSCLTESIPSASVLKEIIQLSIDRLYKSKVVLEIEAGGYQVLNGLMDLFSSSMVSRFRNDQNKHHLDTVWRLVPEENRLSISENSTTYEILRASIDFVSGMTDSQAISTFRKLNGSSIGGL